MDRLSVFLDTRTQLRKNLLLRARTARAAAKTQLYLPGTTSSLAPVNESCAVYVQATSTLNAGRALCRQYKRVALLNFANPVEPGGGVLRGANAQEESLCRASNLYPCLTGANAAAYYAFHQQEARANQALPGSDRLLYTPGVTFFKEESPEGEVFARHWFRADVITCAAPFFPHPSLALPEDELLRLLTGRIANILEAAMANRCDALVLGAFGCGAFNNPPRVVAQAFRQVLGMPRYARAFREICFAIKPTRLQPCPNLSAFVACFGPCQNRA